MLELITEASTFAIQKALQQFQQLILTKCRSNNNISPVIVLSKQNKKRYPKIPKLIFYILN
jgi:hypothetical protein